MRQSRHGFVYILECETGHYKIGKTSQQAEKRISSIQTASPFLVTLFHKIECEDCHEAEKAFHSMFADKRIRGEWFDLDEWQLTRLRDFEFIRNELPLPHIPSWAEYAKDITEEAEMFQESLELMSPWGQF